MNFTHPDGIKLASAPWTKDIAEKLGYPTYYSDEMCPSCKAEPIGKFVNEDRCVSCSNRQLSEIWNLWMQGSPDKPDIFPINIDQALRYGVDYYYTSTPCKRGFHFMTPHIKTGRCAICAHNKKPKLVKETPDQKLMRETPDAIITRDFAIRNSLGVFRTGLPCKNGHTGWRYRSTSGCIPCLRGEAPLIQFKKETPDQKLMRETPNAVITREAAALVGLGVFRTGLPCKHGHTGWRYRSTSGCIPCLRGQPPQIVIVADMLLVSLEQQRVMFIGYAWDGRHFIAPNGKKWNKLQFNALFPIPANYEGSDSNYASDTFIQNFTCK